ncbi:hypothetical protein EUX98_g3623 [Antrodiella citrinella]|uniref:Uncharacterized protein n=1 Tax=Antrodiella citrinella TaxID=2447956 RepID=A0A4S4MW18_9APHY|nr:hypothetical protein EUX98_g3623 [Antrodiella citrinella]
MREKYLLQDRIELLGGVRHSDVGGVFTRGTIFMNTSLTDSFGIAILEAACAGLYVVSTRVGGVPEILPEDMISFANPDEDDVIRAMSEAIRIVSAGEHDSQRAHERIKGFYNWNDVTERTERVYQEVFKTEPYDFWTRLYRTLDIGPFAGLIYVCILLVDCVFFLFLEWWLPEHDLDKVEAHWDPVKFKEHLFNITMAPAIPIPTAYSATDTGHASSQASPSPIRPFALAALGIACFIGIVYMLFCFLYRPKAEAKAKPTGLRELVLPGLIIPKQPKRPLRWLAFLKAVWPFKHTSSEVTIPVNGMKETPEEPEKDLEAQITEEASPSIEDDAPFQSLPEAEPVDTPSLCEDMSPPIPGAWFDLDNLMATPLGDLEAFDSESEYSDDKEHVVCGGGDGDYDDIHDILDEYYTQSSSMLSLSMSTSQVTGVGLGITVPVIQLDSCPSRISPPQDVNFPDEAPQSPVIVNTSPEVEYLDVPPAQFCGKDRMDAEASARSRSHLRRLSTLATVAELCVVKRNPAVGGACPHPFITGSDELGVDLQTPALDTHQVEHGWF